MEHNGNQPQQEPQWRYRVVVEMNDIGGVRVGSNAPSPDVAEMMLYRALKAVERDLIAARLFRVEEPRITPATHLPRGLG